MKFKEYIKEQRYKGSDALPFVQQFFPKAKIVNSNGEQLIELGVKIKGDDDNLKKTQELVKKELNRNRRVFYHRLKALDLIEEDK